MSNHHLQLPPEIVDLILNERRLISSEGYPELRLVCKAINEIVEPWVFSTCTIWHKKQDPETIVWRLPSLTSGTGPYSRWAKKLQIFHQVPDVHGPLDWCEEDRKRMLEHESQWLIPAIRALVNVEEAEYFETGENQLLNDVICALADLPKLRSLRLSVSRLPAQDHIPLERFSNLTTIDLSYDGVEHPSFVESTRRLFNNCPGIVELRFTQGVFSDSAVNLAVLVKDLVDSPTFAPTLKKLVVCQYEDTFLTSACVPFLQSLTHLHILELSNRVDSMFWAALHDSRIHLQELDTPWICRSLVNYLQSYSGLQEIVLGEFGDEYARPYDGDQLCYQFFHAVLPRHKTSLQSINIREETIGPWCLTEAQLNQVHLCQGLKYLSVTLYYPSPEELVSLPVMSLEALFSSIAQNLPNLEHLELKMIRKPRFDWLSRGQPYEQYIDAILRHYAYAISNATFISADREPRFLVATNLSEVVVEGVTFRPISVSGLPGHYRFIDIKQSGVGEMAVVPDPDARADGQREVEIVVCMTEWD